MASIRKRNGRYQVQIRKGSYPLITRTFARLADEKSGSERPSMRLNMVFMRPPLPICLFWRLWLYLPRGCIAWSTYGRQGLALHTPALH